MVRKVKELLSLTSGPLVDKSGNVLINNRIHGFDNVFGRITLAPLPPSNMSLTHATGALAFFATFLAPGVSLASSSGGSMLLGSVFELSSMPNLSPGKQLRHRHAKQSGWEVWLSGAPTKAKSTKMPRITSRGPNPYIMPQGSKWQNSNDNNQLQLLTD